MELAKKVALESMQKTSAIRDDDQIFPVVLPLCNSRGCFPALFQVPATDAALDSSGILKRYRQELDQARHNININNNPALYKALLEVERLLHQEVPSDDDDDDDDDENPFVETRTKRKRTKEELQLLRSKKQFQFPSKGEHHVVTLLDHVHASTLLAAPAKQSLRFSCAGPSKVQMPFGNPAVARAVAPNVTVAEKAPGKDPTDTTQNETRHNATRQHSAASTAAAPTDTSNATNMHSAAPTQVSKPTDTSNTTNTTSAASTPVAKSASKSMDFVSEPTSILTTPAPKRGRSKVKKTIKFPKKPSNAKKLKARTPASKGRPPRRPSSIKKPNRINAVSGDPIPFIVPTWKEVQPLLELFGFTFSNKNLHCFPDGDPSQNSNAVLNRDYFTSLDEFRDNLCARGIEYVGRSPLSGVSGEEEKKDTIKRWVNTAIVTMIRNAPAARKREFCFYEMGPGEVREKLEQYGIIELQSYHWSMPWVQPNGMVAEEAEVLEYLGRHGMPNQFKEQMDPRELASLEFHIAQKFMKLDLTL
jgi:hypothetical protein